MNTLLTSDEVSSRVGAIFARGQKLRQQPATDHQLKTLWPAWNACTPALLGNGDSKKQRRQPQEIIHILTYDGSRWFRRYEGAFQTLRRRFQYLPLNADEYHSALEKATLWTNLVAFARITKEKFEDLVTRQWAFEDADAQAYGRIAIWRVERELEITSPGHFRKTSPTLADINLLAERYEAYKCAHQCAVRQLLELLWMMPGRLIGKYRSKPLDSSKRARGVRTLPHHLFIARLEALDTCSEETFRDFCASDLPALTREKRQEFYDVARSPNFSKADLYALLRIWLAYNQPVFERFDWQGKDIKNAAEENGMKAPANLAKKASEWGLKLKLHRGNRVASDRLMKRSSALLSPAPNFTSGIIESHIK